VVLRLRFDDFSRVTRSQTLTSRTSRTGAILRAERELLAAAMPMIERQGLTLLGISLGNLHNATGQLVLPFEGARAAALDEALDDVRDRFGTEAITRAVLLGRDQGVAMPLLPD
jgi:DNA polymerase-4